MLPARFYTCLPYTLAQEGRPGTKPSDWVNADGTLNAACWSDPRNFSNDAHDAGGATFDGLEQREYSIWRVRTGVPSQDVRLISPDEGCLIYHDQYWAPRCDQLPAGLDLAFFDASVNEGVHEATKIFQWIVGTTSDGMWGAATSAAVNNAFENLTVVDLIQRFTDRRKTVYREMKGFQYFGTDWLRRADEMGTTSAMMARNLNRAVERVT